MATMLLIDERSDPNSQLPNNVADTVPSQAFRYDKLQERPGTGILTIIWDGRQYKKGISRIQACKPHQKGGAGAQDLDQIIKASVYSAVRRAILHPELPWAQLARCLFVDRAQTRTPIFYPAAKYPWTQWLCGNFSLPQDFRWFYLEWKSIMSNDRNGTAHIQEPSTKNEVLNTFFWYHHRMSRTPGAGAKRWGSRIWIKLWEAGYRVLGDVWDVEENTPIDPPGWNSQDIARARSAIRILWRNVPREWKTLASRNRQRWTRSNEPFYPRPGRKERPPHSAIWDDLGVQGWDCLRRGGSM
ncbi:hypothetical protein F4804DRAFT_114018 [Jackrogersella minutella]|nr:hypothetical protein F4804DRAFT_114018 [Jackrogersella minutella]